MKAVVRTLLLGSTLGLSGLWADAATPSEGRSQVQRERQQIETRYREALRQCADKFQVTDCEHAAKAERRAALQPVLKEEQALDLAERQQRAQAQRERVAAKQATKAQEAQDLAQRAATLAANPASASDRARPAAPKASAAHAAAAHRDHEAEAAVAARKAERARISTQRRAEKAQAHEKAVLARDAAERAKGKRAAPLPAPGASAPASAVKP